jgi:hypothetical protein
MNFDLIIHKRNFVVLHMNSKFKHYFTHEFEVLNEYIFYCLSLDFSFFFFKKKKKTYGTQWIYLPGVETTPLTLSNWAELRSEKWI